ncbi:hypothetical protein J5690_00730 [bacterium]|nr:hypothetical protein [bacterium]
MRSAYSCIPPKIQSQVRHKSRHLKVKTKYLQA